MMKKTLWHNRSARSLLFHGIGILFFTSILLFAYTRFNGYIKGPIIVEHNLDSFHTTDEYTILFEGTGKRIDGMRINGREITLRQSGEFSEIITLTSGNNVIDVEIYDRLGNSSRERYTVYVSGDDRHNEQIPEDKALDDDTESKETIH